MTSYNNRMINKWYVCLGIFFCLCSVLLICNIFRLLHAPAKSIEAKLPALEIYSVEAKQGQIGTGIKITAPEFSFAKSKGAASYYAFFTLRTNYNSADHDVCAVREVNKKRHFWITITNTDTGRSAKCWVNDYGPSAAVFPDRIIDLSPKVFKQLSPSGSLAEGVLRHVEISAQ